MERHGDRTRRPAAALLVLTVALVVRAWVLYEGSDGPTFSVPVIDARTYDLAARAFASGQGIDYRFFWQSIFYPLFLGVTYTLLDGSMLAARVVQLLLGVATCGLTFRVGRRLLGPAPGLAAGLICALWGPMILFETELLATGWACFWSILLLDRFTLAHSRDSRRDWFLTGLVAALAVLTRPTFLPAIAVAVVVVLWRSPWRDWAPRAALAALGFALLVSPVAMLGTTVAGHASFLPASGPMNLYLGNHHEPCEVLTIRPGERWNELTRRARPAHAGDLRANREFFGEHLGRSLREHPGALTAGIARKSLQVVSSRELPRNIDPYSQREYAPLLSILMFRVGGFGFPMGLLLPFAVWGAWAARRRVPPVLPIFLATYLTAVVLVFVSARYRMPVVPGLVILGAAGVFALRDALRARARRTLALAGAVVLAVAVLGVAPGPFCEEEVDYRAETLYAVGYALHSAGDLPGAGEYYGRALARRPAWPEALNQYGLLRSQQGRTNEATALWSRALRLEPAHLAARLNLARACALREQFDEALLHYEAALRSDPESGDALIGAGFALLGLARFDEGVARLEQALLGHPEYSDRMPPVIEALLVRGRGDLAPRLQAAMRP